MVVDTFQLLIMTLVTVLGPVIIVTVLALVFPRWRGMAKSSFRLTAIRAGAVIAAARVAVFVVATALMNHGDFRQVVGYFVVMFDALPELALASALNGRRPGGVPLTAALIALTSFAVGWLWALVRIHTRTAQQTAKPLASARLPRPPPDALP
jgi:hypothetical protein